jgi:hypothetical protein
MTNSAADCSIPRKLLDEMKARTLLANRMATRNWRLGFYTTLVAIAATSAAAGVAAAQAPPWITATLAVIPGALFLALRLGRFEQRGRWWRRQEHQVGKIVRAMEYEQLCEKTASERFSQLLCRMEAEYPGFIQMDGPHTDNPSGTIS